MFSNNRPLYLLTTSLNKSHLTAADVVIVPTKLDCGQACAQLRSSFESTLRLKSVFYYEKEPSTMTVVHQYNCFPGCY